MKQQTRKQITFLSCKILRYNHEFQLHGNILWFCVKDFKVDNMIKDRAIIDN